MRSITVAFFALLTACSQQAMYETIQNNQCLEKTGKIYCDEGESYQEYQRKREELIQEGEAH